MPKLGGEASICRWTSWGSVIFVDESAECWSPLDGGSGGTLFHAGRLTNKPASAAYRTVALADAPRLLLPRPIGRATVAAAMIDEAEAAAFAGQLMVPLGR